VSTPIAILERLEIMRIRALIAVVGLFLGLLALAPTVGLTQDGVSLSPPEVQRMAALVAACGDLAPNTLCYGGGAVEIGLTGGQEVPLENIGDRLLLTDVERIQTRISTEDCAWGGVVMNVQGSLPLSQPGMTFIALGNVTVENASAPETLFQPAQAVSINLPSRVNIRTQPSLNADILTMTQASTSLPADALSGDGTWVRVLVGDESAWVFRDLVTSASDLSTLPTLNENARGRMQAFTVRTETSSCESQMPSLLLIQTPEGIPVPLTINGSAFTVGSTVVLTRSSAVGGSTQGLFGSDGGAGNPQGDLTAGDGVPPDPDYESLLVIEGSVAALLADGSVMPIAEGCVFNAPTADRSVLAQDDRLAPDEPSLICGSHSSLTGSDGGLDSSLTGSDGGLGSPILTLSDGQTGSLDLVSLLNGMVLDMAAPPVTIAPAEWVEAHAKEQETTYSGVCEQFEGISPQSGSILLAPSPLVSNQITFDFPLLPPDLGYFYPEPDYVGYKTKFHLSSVTGAAVALVSDAEYVGKNNIQSFFDSPVSPISLDYSYPLLSQLDLITANQTNGTLHWWVEFTGEVYYVYDEANYYQVYHHPFACVTDLYTLHWSNDARAELIGAPPSVLPTVIFDSNTFGLLPLLNDLLLVDIGDQGISTVPEYVVEWTEISNNENSQFCEGFEGISPHSSSILLAPSPQNNSQLTPTQLTFIFPLVPSDLTDMDFDDISSPVGFDTMFYLATEQGIQTSFGFDQNQIAGYVEMQGNVIESITFSYNELIENNLIAEGQTSGTLVWWAEFNFSNDQLNLDYTCVTDLYTLNWSNTPGEPSAQTISTAVHNFPTPANTLPATENPLNTLGLSATPPFTLPSPTSVPPTNAPPPTNPPPTSVPPTNVPPTNPPPTANPDRDGDGVANDQDGCPDEAGPRENGGCPLPPPPPDGDGDGVPDEVDVCPGIPGPRDNRGCPARG
jgi:hypothetical protein